MIKNPYLNQKVWYFSNFNIVKGRVNKLWPETKAVELNNYFYRENKEIFSTQESAEKHRPKVYEKAIKTLNKKIFEFSKEREKLASKLAKLLK